MSRSSEYFFRMEKTSYKTQDLTYEEPGYKLVIALEMTGGKQFDWVGADTNFLEWDVPAGEVIPLEKRREILCRLAEWSRCNRVRIDIGPPIDMQTYFSEQEHAGCKLERRPDGTTVVYPRPRQSLLAHLIGMISAFLKQAPKKNRESGKSGNVVTEA